MRKAKYLMQLIPRYLCKNRIRVIVNQLGHITEYTPVHTRQLELQRGIDNVIQFMMINADQKPVDVFENVRFVALDSNNNVCLDLPGEPVSWDDSTIRTGLFSVVISASDLRDIEPQYLSYWLKLVDFDGTQTLTYTDPAFGCISTARVRDDIEPRTRPVAETTFGALAYQNDNWYTDPVNLDTGINGNRRLHTTAIYTNGYEGEIQPQVSLELNSSDPASEWSNIGEPIAFDGTETEPALLNIHGSFNYLRFVSSKDPENTITKILVRN